MKESQRLSQVETALNKISPNWAASNHKKLPSCQENDFFDLPYDFLDFNIALENKNAASSPGLDGIDYEILQKLPIKYKLLLLDIFNCMQQNNEFPKSWKEAYIHFVPKADGSLRPIALTSSSCLARL